jgi:RNA methyltransferase, TrmH family
VVLRCAPNVIERAATTEAPKPHLAIVHLAVAHMPDAADFVIVADRLADPGNAGTIIRTAEACGADAVAFTPGSVDAFNPKVVRASAGSLFRVPVLVMSLHELALTRVGTSSHQGVAYTDCDLRRPVAVVLGNEAHGLGPDAEVDEWVTIPHVGAAESLNVAMAATVLAFEVARQRRRSYS